ncbi:uncharacterized protein F4812DRAFT_456746 [Daldinia caldariorum]|uniref:uncharacterized protein n=1 Tax=Daldinia caldariorum TaxID=326644 RepID=UPI002008CFAC|nr:uncharacterized protein F4812DRAFT_456746 [Daldinia caldariorum]KAI1470734.1 hypothetical protein F4812DRAFT_456746 [Daldinia caldariorum]
MQDSSPLGMDIPSPLHIIKRGRSMQVLRCTPRKISNESVDDDPNQPLTITKNRKYQDRSIIKKNLTRVDEVVLSRSFRNQSGGVTANIASNKAWDPVTPRLINAPVSRRSSSLKVGRPTSPTFFSRLRSLSNRKTLSSKPDYYQHSSHTLSSSSDESILKSSNEYPRARSWDRSSDSDYSVPSIYPNEFVVNRFDGQTFESTQGPDNISPDPYILVPHISIIPESKSLEDGQSDVWTAIEISGRLFHPRGDNSAYDTDQAPFIPVHHCDIGLSRYGYLYNIRVDVLPVAEGSVIDLIGDTMIRTISPGTSILLLACIRLGTSNLIKPRADRHDPDSLIADLENQLGSARTEYLQVRVHYCHSGFPKFGKASIDNDTGGSVSTCQTRLETAVTGTIQQHASTSAWSPRPTPPTNPLFPIIASHWGPIRANEIMQRIMSNRPTSRRTAKWMRIGQRDRTGDVLQVPNRAGTAPPIPQRQASLKRLSPERISDPARKIWTELRRTSSGNRPAFHVSKANRLPAATTFVEAPNSEAIIRPGSTRPESRSDVQRQREMIRETAVRNRRSIGADSLKSLVPSVVDTDPGSRDDGATGSPSTTGKQEVQTDKRKRDGRWSLGGWW